VPAGEALSRSAALPGDDVWVSGELGGASLGIVHPGIEEAAMRLHRPQPRVELGMRLRPLAHAAIDVSDGLAGDLGHILERSGVSAVLEYAAIPKAKAFAALGDAMLEQECVLSGGDDYELLFTAPRPARSELESLSGELGVALSRIGVIRAGAPRLTVLDSAGRPMSYRAGYDHFAR
jgi:thiamine-monophosphate kinase